MQEEHYFNTVTGVVVDIGIENGIGEGHFLLRGATDIEGVDVESMREGQQDRKYSTHIVTHGYEKSFQNTEAAFLQ